ncbi:unnamed protein product [Phytophthora lilii]|uniref:Unnamed protein product n=1 Tax=Phytophthora lilii TaxID=2077276 RepID=A0A9W6XR25_9STRA|nr:unnamed protein product [Phytophthora lilii]
MISLNSQSVWKGIRPDRGYLPSASATAASAQLSNIIPQIHPTSSYIVPCDLIKNEYVASGDIVSAFDRGDAEIGKLISVPPDEYRPVAGLVQVPPVVGKVVGVGEKSI